MNDLSHAIPLRIYNKLLIYNVLEGRIPKLGSDEEYPSRAPTLALKIRNALSLILDK
jgi:hypothetical protein